jgi:hypothetical protein
MEVLPKRYRSGSISSRLRSASELLEDGVIETRHKGILKDLIISGDEALADALSRYERGDKEPIKNLLREGVLNRKSSLDLLGDVGDLSFDFLSVSAASNAFTSAMKGNLDAPFPMDEEEMTFEILLQESTDTFGGKSPPKKFLSHASFSLGRAQMGQRSSSLSSIPGISSSYNAQHHSKNSHQTKSLLSSSHQLAHSQHVLGTFSSLGTPPPDLFEISMLEEAGVGAWTHPALRGNGSMRKDTMLDFDSDDLESPPSSPKRAPASSAGVLPPTAPKSNGQTKLRKQATPKASPKNTESGSASATSAPIVIPKPSKANGGAGRQSSGSSTKARISASGANAGNNNTNGTEKAHAAAAVPTLTTEERAASRRAQGVPMVGAYSPESRKIRVERFVAKRDRRVWKKKVKYDVRKNFADSRLRVKGRFVKKEEEEALKELMSWL